MYKNCITLFTVLMCTIAFSQTVTKTYDPGFSTSVDGVGNFANALPSVTFSAADFPNGDQITDVNVSITWAKTDGTCSVPSGGNSHHEETSFRIDATNITQVILANSGTWSGGDDIEKRTTIFDQAAASIPSGTPTSGTFLPNGGNLDTFNGQNPLGDWNLSAGDNGFGDPLCVESYSITITAVDVTNPTPDVDPLPDVTAACEVTSLTPPTATDNVATTVTVTNDATLPIITQGTTVVTWTYDDGNGNTVDQLQNVVIDDITPPAITCPMEFETTSPYTILDYSGNVTDNCSSGVDLTITQVPAAGTMITGSQIVNVTINASDAEGNNATECAFRIAVGTTLSIESNSFEEALNIYPNPTSGRLTIDISENIQLTEAKIYDVSGRVVKIKNMSNTNTYNLDISDLTSGIYFLHVQSSDQKEAVKKIIKK